METGDYFAPSADRALACREAMESSLWASVRRILDASLPDQDRHDRTDTLSRHASPLDFGAYFDLSLRHPGGMELSDCDKAKARKYLATRLAAEQIGETSTDLIPSARNLSPDDLSLSDIDRLERWWDTEPENAMGLTGVAKAEMDDARAAISSAFDRLRECAPELCDEICVILDEIVIARPNGQQRLDFSGVSSFALWGAAALNFDAHSTWPSYFRTIVHEAGHNLLFAYARNQPLVSDDPAERRLSPLREDARPLDGIYHAGFVSARESLALDRLLSWHERMCVLSDPEVRVVTEMLEDSVISFWRSAETLRGEAHLTSLGETILCQCEDWMRDNFTFEFQHQ